MHVLHLSTYDTAGGAARASYRLHQGLLKAGVHSQQLVLQKNSQDPTIYAYQEPRFVRRFRAIADQWPLNAYPHRARAFSAHWVPNSVPQAVKNFSFDILHIHWINRLLIPEALPQITPKPIVWTLHDMWAITGGCHYTQGCDLFTTQCGRCPQLHSFKPMTYPATFGNAKKGLGAIFIPRLSPPVHGWLTKSNGVLYWGIVIFT